MTMTVKSQQHITLNNIIVKHFLEHKTEYLNMTTRVNDYKQKVPLD